MNSGIFFLLKTLVVTGFLSQAASAEPVLFGSLDEPVLLTLCGGALLLLGMFQGRAKTSR